MIYFYTSSLIWIPAINDFSTTKPHRFWVKTNLFSTEVNVNIRMYKINFWQTIQCQIQKQNNTSNHFSIQNCHFSFINLFCIFASKKCQMCKIKRLSVNVHTTVTLKLMYMCVTAIQRLHICLLGDILVKKIYSPPPLYMVSWLIWHSFI